MTDLPPLTLDVPTPDVALDVRRLMIGYSQTVRTYPAVPSDEIRDFRIELIEEEVVRELIPAMRAGDLEGVADGIVDAIVVLLGAAHAYGLPFDALWREVQRTNVDKFRGPKRPDGKQLKPEGWQPPRIAEILSMATKRAFSERIDPSSPHGTQTGRIDATKPNLSQ